MPRSTKAGHVKRPWNRFFCFMYSDAGKKIQSECSVGQDKKRLVSDKWNAMTTEEREPYVLEAEKRKKEHKALYPDYHYQVEQTVESSKARGSIRSRKIPGNVAAELRTQEQSLNHQIIVFSVMPEHECIDAVGENLEHREYKWDTVRVGTLDSYSSMSRQAATPLHAVTTETDGRLEKTLPSSPLSETHPEILNNLSLLIPPESDYSPSTLTSLPSPSSNSSPWPSPFPSPDSAFSNASLPSSAYEPIACLSSSFFSNSALGLDFADACIQAPAGGDAQDILSDFDFWHIDPVNEFFDGVASMRNSYELQPRVGQSHWPSLPPAVSTPPLATLPPAKSCTNAPQMSLPSRSPSLGLDLGTPQGSFNVSNDFVDLMQVENTNMASGGSERFINPDGQSSSEMDACKLNERMKDWFNSLDEYTSSELDSEDSGLPAYT